MAFNNYCTQINNDFPQNLLHQKNLLRNKKTKSGKLLGVLVPKKRVIVRTVGSHSDGEAFASTHEESLNSITTRDPIVIAHRHVALSSGRSATTRTYLETN